MTQYRNVALGELSPHVYAIAEQVETHSSSSYAVSHDPVGLSCDAIC